MEKKQKTTKHEEEVLTCLFQWSQNLLQSHQWRRRNQEGNPLSQIRVSERIKQKNKSSVQSVLCFFIYRQRTVLFFGLIHNLSVILTEKPKKRFEIFNNVLYVIDVWSREPDYVWSIHQWCPTSFQTGLISLLMDRVFFVSPENKRTMKLS